GTGQALYDLSLRYGIADEYALAFFLHESSFGTTGVARVTRSLGNIRCSDGYRCIDGYRAYLTWEAGYEDWYKLIKDGYLIVQVLRSVEGVVQEGKRKGEKWQFLSIEINDTRYGHIWSCQVRSDDEQYAHLQGADLINHKVKVTIRSQSAGPREMADGQIGR